MHSNRKAGGRTPLVLAILAVTAVAALVLGACEDPLGTAPQEYEITLRVDPTSGGRITGDHDVDGSSVVVASPGDEFSWEAVPAAGYAFSGWSSSTTGSSTDNPLTYTAQDWDTVTASFSPLQEVTISFDTVSSVDEDRGPVTVTLRVFDPPGTDLDVGVKLSGTAVRGSGDDYTVSGLSGTGEYETATIPAGSASTTFEIAFVNDDVAESDETIVVSLDDSSPDYTAGPDNTLTIVNDDAGLSAPAINTPFSYDDGPDGPIYVSGPQSISITNLNGRGTIYYTTDNTDPMSSGTRTEYTDAFDINATTTIKAVVEDGAEQSPEEATTATFQLFDPTVQVNGGDFTGGTVTAGDSVGLITYHVPNGSEVDQGATYYYTLAANTPADPDSNSTAYSTAFELTEPRQLKVIAIRDGWESSNVVSVDLTSMQIDVSISGSMANVGDSTYTVTTVPAAGVTVNYSIDAVAPDGSRTELSTGSGDTITVKAGVTHQQLEVTATKTDYVAGTAVQTVENYEELFYVDEIGNVWEYDATETDVRVGSMTVDDIGLYENRLLYLDGGTIKTYDPYGTDPDFNTGNDWPSSGTITTIAGRSGYVSPGTNGFSGSALSYLVDNGGSAAVYHYDPSGDDPEDDRFAGQGGAPDSAIGQDDEIGWFLFTGTGGSVYASEDDDGDGTYDDPTLGNEFPNADFDTIEDLGFYGMGSGSTKQLYLNLDGSSNYELRVTDASGSTDEVLSGIDNEVRAFTSY